MGRAHDFFAGPDGTCSWCTPLIARRTRGARATDQPDRNIFAGLNGFLRKVRENTRAAAGRRCDKSYLLDSLHVATSHGCERVQ